MTNSKSTIDFKPFSTYKKTSKTTTCSTKNP
ncbi:hypothetical protein CpecF_0593 [Chlamydia pecorum DBDeUG]|nr:hypothetical protein CpecF_0593 [Chlamydia pecorum DBDeUG]